MKREPDGRAQRGGLISSARVVSSWSVSYSRVARFEDLALAGLESGATVGMVATGPEEARPMKRSAGPRGSPRAPLGSERAAISHGPPDHGSWHRTGLHTSGLP